MVIRTVLAATAVAAATLVAAAPLAAHRTDGSSWSYTWKDGAGDSGTAPDIGSIEVGADDSGRALFRVWSPNADTDHSSIVSVYIDADPTGTAGDPDMSGADYELDSYNEDDTYSMERWNATTGEWESDPDDDALTVSYNSERTTFSLDRKLLGGAETVRVFAETVAGADAYGDGQRDEAPDRDVVEYRLTPLRLASAGFAAVGKKAGKTLTLGLVTSRSDVSDAYVSGDAASISCAAHIGSRRAAALGSGFVTVEKLPVATCVWRLARSQRGKVVHASITVGYAGRSLTKAVTFKAS